MGGHRDLEKKCMRQIICTSYEEFAEIAENSFTKEQANERLGGRNFFRTRMPNQRTQQAYASHYLECHKKYPNCRRQGSECKCNKKISQYLLLDGEVTTTSNGLSSPDTGTKEATLAFQTTTGFSNY